MAYVSGSKGSFQVKAYIGDNKTLLAFNFNNQTAAKNLAGFTIFCHPPGQPGYYLLNELQFQNPTTHAQVATEKPNSTANAPVQKYRWVHVTGVAHQGLNPATGEYTYIVTPRFFDANGSMQALDSSLSASVAVQVGPFKKNSLTLGFTRGYMQSEAFVRHFGQGTRLIPANRQLQFDTATQAGTNNGQSFTYEEIYAWTGSTARQQVFAVLNGVLNDPSAHLDLFAYDLDEPDVVGIFLKLAAQGRIRIILDNAQLHVTHTDPKTHKTITPMENSFTTVFKQQAKAGAQIVRGCFARYSHDKVFIVSRNGSPAQVLTGSTNFSVNGLYVNANHVLVFDDPAVAAEYAKVFEESWQLLSQAKTPSKKVAAEFASSDLASQPFTGPASSPKMTINFSPHTSADVDKILGAISSRAESESNAAKGNVLFAVMQLTGSQTPVYNTLKALYKNQSLYSYGISDSPAGVHLYAAGSAMGVLVTGKPGQTTLPAPFDQVPIPPGHEIHDKFVVCGLNGKDPVVYCGSSNLATGGEAANGDNLLEIHDPDVATAFAIEALLLVDHYNFLDRCANPKKAAASQGSPVNAKGKAAGTGAVAKKRAKTKAIAKKTPARKAPARTVAKKKAARPAAVSKKKAAKKIVARKHPPRAFAARAGR